MNHVLTIAGSDCSGGAGIQADMKTFAAHGVYGMSVIVSVVAENTQRVIGAQDISPTLIAEQLQAVFEDIRVDASKSECCLHPQSWRVWPRIWKGDDPATSYSIL
jgi:hydroxymethylpyrimidine/phosphomethylpyrimidine kinase